MLRFASPKLLSPYLLSRLGVACNREFSALPAALSELSTTKLSHSDTVKSLLTLSYAPDSTRHLAASHVHKLKQDVLASAKLLSSPDLEILVYAEMRNSTPNIAYTKFLLGELFARPEIPGLIALVHCLLPEIGNFQDYISALLGKFKIDNSRHFRQLGEILYVLPDFRDSFASSINRTLKMKISKSLKQNPPKTPKTPNHSDLFAIFHFMALADVLALTTIEAFISLFSKTSPLPWRISADLLLLRWILDQRGVLVRLSPETQTLLTNLKPLKVDQPLLFSDFLGVIDSPKNRASAKIRLPLKPATVGPFLLLHAHGKQKLALIPDGPNYLRQPALKKLRDERNLWLTRSGWTLQHTTSGVSHT
jgi:hypothetical protein